MSEAITTTPPITTERKQFLFDVFVLFIEGAIGYWFVCSKYQHRIADPSGFHARGHEEGESKKITINAATIEKGLYLIRQGGSDLNDAGKALHMHHSLRSRVIGAEGTLNVGDIDVELADCIVQIGLFGEVIYG